MAKVTILRVDITAWMTSAPLATVCSTPAVTRPARKDQHAGVTAGGGEAAASQTILADGNEGVVRT